MALLVTLFLVLVNKIRFIFFFCSSRFPAIFRWTGVTQEPFYLPVEKGENWTFAKRLTHSKLNQVHPPPGTCEITEGVFSFALLSYQKVKSPFRNSFVQTPSSLGAVEGAGGDRKEKGKEKNKWK